MVCVTDRQSDKLCPDFYGVISATDNHHHVLVLLSQCEQGTCPMWQEAGQGVTRYGWCDLCSGREKDGHVIFTCILKEQS